MARIIDEGMAGPDDPIYTEGLRIVSVRRIVNEKEKKKSEEKPQTKNCDTSVVQLWNAQKRSTE